MDTPLQAIEVVGTELTEQQWLRAAVTNPAFDFLHDPAEDIYTPSDGKPCHVECKWDVQP